jgi:hypothetical protein
MRLLIAIFLLFPPTGNKDKRITFNRYRVNSTFKDHRASLILKDNSLATMYKTVITKTYNSEGLNFAGHYCFVWWGCGSDCQHAAVVDLKTGIVYDGPTAARRFKFKRSSRLVIVNPRDSNAKIDDTCAFCAPEFWVWNENSKKFYRTN